MHVLTTASPRTQNVPPVVEAVEKKNYSVEITKGDVSLMCQHSGGEEETEVKNLYIHRCVANVTVSRS